MKILKSFVVFIIYWGAQCFSLETAELFKAIEQRDSAAIISFFDQIDSITIEEAHELISDFYSYYVFQFGTEILNSQEYQNKLDQYKKLYHLILKERGISFRNSLIHNEGIYSHQTLLCRKKKDHKTDLEAEVPSSMILGGIEILSGSLIWVLPFPGAKQIGGFMIADGIRRTFNGLEDMDEQNKNDEHRNDLFEDRVIQ